MNQKIANNMCNFTLYNIYTLIREKIVYTSCRVRKIAWRIGRLPAKPCDRYNTCTWYIIIMFSKLFI